jgi:hypothetical protein
LAGRNLKAMKRERRTAEPMKGNFMASCWCWCWLVEENWREWSEVKEEVDEKGGGRRRRKNRSKKNSRCFSFAALRCSPLFSPPSFELVSFFPVQESNVHDMIYA